MSWVTTDIYSIMGLLSLPLGSNIPPTKEIDKAFHNSSLSWVWYQLYVLVDLWSLVFVKTNVFLMLHSHVPCCQVNKLTFSAPKEVLKNSFARVNKQSIISESPKVPPKKPKDQQSIHPLTVINNKQQICRVHSKSNNHIVLVIVSRT